MDADSLAVSPHYIDPDLIRQILRWKRVCETTHGSVCNTRYSDYMFKQLQTINLVDVETLSLVTTSLSTKFVALSYVWGSIPIFKTQTSNIHLLRTPGSLSGANLGILLPATISDAIYLTRKLGEKYLWVDCLCVVQDADSLEQSLRAMAAIYASAEFTIVDAVGENANHGLKGVCSSSQHHAVQCNRCAGNSVTTSLDGGEPCPWASTWASRGWTFQESLFSRRLLVFGALVLWICGRCIWLEDETDFSSMITEVNEVEWPLEREHLGIPVGLMSILPELPSLGRWGNLVETFSERALTYERDIVNAFAGATEVMSATFPGGILHGLPMFYFDLALLWQPQEAIFRRNSDNNHTFPSWSWTGWKGAVSCLGAWSPFEAGLYRATDHYSDWISIVELCPVAHWQKISLIEESREIQIQRDFYRFQAFRDKVEGDLPLGWSRHDHADGVYFMNQDHNPGFRYSFPLPVPKHPESDQHDGFGHILRCTAPRAVARLGEIKDDIWSRPLVELLADTGKVIGCLRLHNIHELGATKGDSCELIAISLEKIKDFERMQEDLSTLSLPEWAISEWEMNSGGSHDMFYNVMWIGWDGDVAYRKGLGKVGKEAWSYLQPALTSFKLG